MSKIEPKRLVIVSDAYKKAGSIQRLADILHVHYTTVNGWFTWKNGPSEDNVIYMKRYLNDEVVFPVKVEPPKHVLEPIPVMPPEQPVRFSTHGQKTVLKTFAGLGSLKQGLPPSKHEPLFPSRKMDCRVVNVFLTKRGDYVGYAEGENNETVFITPMVIKEIYKEYGNIVPRDRFTLNVITDLSGRSDFVSNSLYRGE
jgi:hypothetical protein